MGIWSLEDRLGKEDETRSRTHQSMFDNEAHHEWNSQQIEFVHRNLDIAAEEITEQDCKKLVDSNAIQDRFYPTTIVITTSIKNQK